MVKATGIDPEAHVEGAIKFAATSGGIFLDMAIHDIDLMRWFLGGEVTEVYAAGTTFKHPEFAENGDTETGVSIMQMDEGLDTGDVLVCEKIAIGPEETSGELFDRVTAVGARVLCEAVPAMEAGTLKPQPQQHENATLAPMLDKELAEFRLTDTAAHIHNWVRGMNPWPMAWFVTTGGKKVKVTECRVAASDGEAPGTVLSTKPLTVACADGAVQLLHVVPEGKKPMDGTSFAAGLRLKAGDTL